MWLALIMICLVIMQAASQKHLDAVNALLVARADPNVQLQSAAISTALQIASHNGHAEIALALIDSGAEVDVQSQTGCTALHHAVGGLHIDVVNHLLQAECDNDIQNSNGSTALHIAAGKGQSELIKVRYLALICGRVDAQACPLLIMLLLSFLISPRIFFF